jgi:hypothetical protein
MNMPLKMNANPVRQRPYRLKLKYREKVKEEIDRMVET